MKKIFSIFVLISFLLTNFMPITAFADDNTLTGAISHSINVPQQVYENVSQEVYDSQNSNTISTSVPPENYIPQNTFIDKPQKIQAAAANQKRVLLIEDNNPWNTNSNQEVLAGLTEFDKVTTNDFLSVDLSKYGMVVFANDQSFSMYENYRQFKEYLEVFASMGGVIVFGACDGGWAGGTLNENLPGDVKKEANYQYRNHIVDFKHPIVTGSLTDNLQLLDSDLNENFCSHISFVEGSLPIGSRVILREDETNKPTLVEYPLGKGRVIASGLTWEYNYVYGVENQNQYAKKAMDDMFKYGLYVSDINRDDLQVLQNYYIRKNVHTVFVGDSKTRNPIKDATIRINGYEVQTDDKGMAEISRQYGVNTVEIGASGYQKSKLIYNVQPRTVRYFYLRVNSDINKPYFSMAMLKDGGSNYVDIMNQLTYYTEDSPYMCNINLSGEWSSVPAGKYVLYQRDKSIQSVDGKFYIAPGKIFKPGERIYAVMIGANGAKSDPISTGIIISPKALSGGVLPDAKNGFKIGQKMGFTVPNNLPVLGGTELDLKLDFIPISFIQEGNKVKFGLGVSDALNLKDNWQDFTKTMDKVRGNVKKTELWNELSQKYGSKKGYLSIKKGWDPELKVGGYGEGIIDDQGKITSIRGYLLLDAGAIYKHQMQYVVGPVPVYVELGGGVELNIDAGFDKILREEGTLTVTSNLTITPKFSLGGGLGIVGALQVGATGNADLPVTFKFPQNYQEVRLIGSMKITASALFVFSAEREVLHGEWVIYNNTPNGVNPLLRNQQAMRLDLTDTSKYKQLKRDYISKTSKWQPEIKRAQSLGLENSEFTILQDSVLPNTMPQLINIDGKLIMVFQGDDATRDNNNRTVLLYSVFENGSWSNPLPVWDNGAPDFNASLKTDGVNVYVAWQKAAKPYEEVPDQDIEKQLTDMSSLSEIAVARWDGSTNAFVYQSYVTNNNTLDMMPALTINNGKPYIAWVNNDNNNVFGNSGKNTLMFGTKANENWVSNNTGVFYTNPVINSDIAVINERIHLAHTVDMDQDLNTNEDIELYLYSGDNNERITNNNVLDAAPKFDGSLLYWCSGKSLNTYNVQTQSKNTIVSEESTVNSSFKLLKNISGKNAILWTTPIGENKTSVRAVLKGDNGWGKEIEIARRPDTIQYFDGVFTEDGKWNLAANATDYSLPETKTALVYTMITPKKDIMLKSVYGDDLKRNSNTQPIVIEVTNSGDKIVESLNLTVFDSTGVNMIEEQNLITNLPPGDSKAIPVDITIPDLHGKTEFVVQVDTDNETNLTDNKERLTLGYTDVSLKVTRYVLEDKIMLVSQVSNLSDIPSNVAITIAEDSADGVVLDMKNLGTIDGEKDIVYTYEIDKSKIDFKDKNYKVYSIEIKSSNEDIIPGNNYETIVIDSTDPIVFTGEPGEPVQIINATGVKIQTESPIRLFYSKDSEDNNTIGLQAAVLPSDATFKDVFWSVSDDSILEIDSDGTLRAIGVGNANVTVTSFDGNYTDTIPVQVLPAETPLYNLNITAGTGGTITTGTSGSHIAGDVINIAATPNNGYTFAGWTSSNGGTFADANIASTTFTMPADSTIITANFTLTGGEGGGGGGSSSYLALSTVLLNDAVVGLLYNSTIVTNGKGVAPYSFMVSSGALPNGLSLASGTGVISGTPTKIGSYNFTVKVKDANNKTASKSYTLKVNALPTGFTDIASHWAMKNITKLVGMGVIAGYQDATFKPNSNITRAEFTTMLVKAFSLAPKFGKIYSDTTNHWSKDYIATAESYGIVSGYDASNFKPDELITREQMAVMVVKAAKLSHATGDINFIDSGAISPWAKVSVITAVADGIIEGYPGNTFNPGGKATRAEAVTVIVNTLK